MQQIRYTNTSSNIPTSYINKVGSMSPTHYSSTDMQTTDSLFDMLKGIALLAAGGGLAYGSLKGLRKRVFEATAPEIVQPSALVRKRMRDSRIPVNPQYLPDTDEEKQDDSDLEKQSSYLVGTFCKYAAGDDDPSSKPDIAQRIGHGIGSFFWNLGSGFASGFRRKEEPAISKLNRNWYEGVEAIRKLNSSDIKDMNARGITLHTLESARGEGGLTRLKAELAARPGLRSAWFLPAATAIGIGGFSLGKSTADLVEKALGKSQPKMTYEEDAKKIYEESAQYLKDVAEGKDVEDPEEETDEKKKKKLIKESTSKAPIKPYVPPKDVVSGDGSSRFWGWSSLIGVPLAFLVARQLGNFREGVLDVKEELADRTHMIRAWQAAAKERNYDYNDLTSEISPEPMPDEVAKRILKKEKELQDRIQDDDNNNQLRYENYLFKDIRDDQESMI